jgi:cysteine dioxygenase
MTVASIPTALQPIVRYLDCLTGRAPLPELSMLLKQTDLRLEDLRECARFDDQHYCRNLVSGGPWYDLLVICWRSGQRSPIHDHAGSSCAFKVLTGVCSETVYAFSACGQAYPVETTDQPAGAIVSTQDADTHQVSNLQPAGCDLVTLHIYSPPLKAMHTFSILGEAVRQWRAPQGQGADIIYGDDI